MNSTDFAEANPKVTLAWTKRFLQAHSIGLQDFIAAFGEAESYDTAQVLGWAGY